MYSDKSYFLTKINEAELEKLTAGNDDNLESAIRASCSLIDFYLSNKIKLPLANVPEIVKQWSYDIAVFYLHDRIQYMDIPQRVKDKFDATINILKEAAGGKINIYIEEAEKEELILFDVNIPVFDRKI